MTAPTNADLRDRLATARAVAADARREAAEATVRAPASPLDIYGLSRRLMETHGLTWRAAIREVTLPGVPPPTREPVELARFETMRGST